MIAVNFLVLLFKMDKNSIKFLVFERKRGELLIILEEIPLKPYGSPQGLRIGSYDLF